MLAESYERQVTEYAVAVSPQVDTQDMPNNKSEKIIYFFSGISLIALGVILGFVGGCYKQRENSIKKENG